MSDKDKELERLKIEIKYLKEENKELKEENRNLNYKIIKQQIAEETIHFTYTPNIVKTVPIGDKPFLYWNKITC